MTSLSTTTEVSNIFSSFPHQFRVAMDPSNKYQCFFQIRFFLSHISIYRKEVYKIFEKSGMLNNYEKRLINRFSTVSYNKISSYFHKFRVFMNSPNHFSQFHSRLFKFYISSHGNNTYKIFEEVSHAKK